MEENAVKAEVSTDDGVLMSCVVAVQACLASGVKADPSLAAKKFISTTKAFYNSTSECSSILFRGKLRSTHIEMSLKCSASFVLISQID